MRRTILRNKSKNYVFEKKIIPKTETNSHCISIEKHRSANMKTKYENTVVQYLPEHICLQYANVESKQSSLFASTEESKLL